MADPNPARGMPKQLERYWLAGKGLARWAVTPTPYRSLVAALASEGVPAKVIHGLAAKLYHKHFGVWPGDHEKQGGKAPSAVRLAGRARK